MLAPSFRKYSLLCFFQSLLCVSYATLCTDLSSGACQRLLQKHPDACSTAVREVCQETCGYCPLTCYYCDEEISPENCTQTVQCDTTNQLCVALQRFHDDYSVFYTSGCAEKQICEHLLGFTKSPQSRSYHLHGGCCDYNSCNIHDPQTMTSQNPHPPRPSGSSPILATSSTLTNKTCSPYDMDEDACLLMQIADPNLCSRQEIAARVCPSTCGTCLECVSCERAATPESCNAKKTCELYQKCVTVESLGADFSVGYRMGCVDDQVCQRYFPESGKTVSGRQLPGFSLKGQCCHTSNCNQHGIVDASITGAAPIG